MAVAELFAVLLSNRFTKRITEFIGLNLDGVSALYFRFEGKGAFDFCSFT